MLFKDRQEAAHQIAQRLSGYAGVNALVLGIPRGAVPMAKIIADAIGGELDVVLVHKLTAPQNPELAIGSIDETGHTYLSRHLSSLGVSEDYLEAERRSQLETLQRRRLSYTPIKSPANPKDRTVIVVDNGVATGLTMIAALRSVRVRQPTKLVAAMAVAPPSVVVQINQLADEVVCLRSPADFRAVGQFYENFCEVSDHEVIEALKPV
ncbi:phosphoribosyltransferase [Thalassoporum mexicanum PCC 7367]|uniref:phosphoribosyltransferase n=1 Tax=Thalassoporum mexicanum TaxID=3457544 RepID=UPI00029FAD69|nr:phosphoribosyltransferase family protein [Pseudanabaena sp. PCC 7367]AFY68599.1 phosphoribosyltransferase [Pseudanabaena sp. PCC 7367]